MPSGTYMLLKDDYEIRKKNVPLEMGHSPYIWTMELLQENSKPRNSIWFRAWKDHFKYDVHFNQRTPSHNDSRFIINPEKISYNLLTE